MDYATVEDVAALWRPLSAEESAMTGQLLPLISAELRRHARQTGRNLDAMLAEDPDLAAVARSVCVDVVRRYISDNAAASPSLSQMTQSVGGYSVSGTFLVPGGGLFIKKSELTRLGLRRQKVQVIEL